MTDCDHEIRDMNKRQAKALTLLINAGKLVFNFCDRCGESLGETVAQTGS